MNKENILSEIKRSLGCHFFFSENPHGEKLALLYKQNHIIKTNVSSVTARILFNSEVCRLRKRLPSDIVTSPILDIFKS